MQKENFFIKNRLKVLILKEGLVVSGVLSSKAEKLSMV